ncbi:MAG: hypothetical protein ABJO09_01595 [Hyphomicrobiales bacterium]
MTKILSAPLKLFARHAQWVLVGGLIAGIAFPAAAGVLRPYIPEMVALILFLSALRMELSALKVSRKQLAMDFLVILGLQLATPFAVYAILTALNVPNVWRDVLTVLYSGAAISGTPAFAFLMGLDGVRAMRLLVIGTALMPVTTLPVLALLPNIAAETSLLEVSIRLLLLIAAAAAAAFTLRKPVIRALGKDAPLLLNGLNALALAIFVLALMDAIQPVLKSDPIRVLWVLAIACIANLGTQVIYAIMIALRAKSDGRVPTPSELTPTIGAGNRNMALFLAALPANVTDPWLLFIGCYQVPMYLTPLLMPPLLQRLQGISAKTPPES